MLVRRITLADVAREVGVHVTTVSLALRNSRRLSAATRARIKKVARRMNYRSEPLLQALVPYRGRTRPRPVATLAYVTSWDTRLRWQSSTAHPQCYRGAQARATELGFKLEHFWGGEPGLPAARLTRILLARGISGLILASYCHDAGDAPPFDCTRFSAVAIGSQPQRPALHNVTTDQCGIVRLAVQRARAAGYRRIGFVMHRGWCSSCDSLWAAGFLGEQAQMDPADHVPMLLFPPAGPADACRRDASAEATVSTPAFERWFNRHRPELIISKASFVNPALTALGLGVPDTVAFVDLFVEDARGFAAGVRQNHREVGEQAVELLAAQLQQGKFGPPAIGSTTLVPGTWVDGASCPAHPETPLLTASCHAPGKAIG